MVFRREAATLGGEICFYVDRSVPITRYAATSTVRPGRWQNRAPRMSCPAPQHDMLDSDMRRVQVPAGAQPERSRLGRAPWSPVAGGGQDGGLDGERKPAATWSSAIVAQRSVPRQLSDSEGDPARRSSVGRRGCPEKPRRPWYIASRFRCAERACTAENEQSSVPSSGVRRSLRSSWSVLSCCSEGWSRRAKPSWSGDSPKGGGQPPFASGAGPRHSDLGDLG